MLLTSQSIKQAPNFLSSIQKQSTLLLAVHGEKPRLAAIFSSQDRWLMGHIGMALHFESFTAAGREGLNAATFIRRVTHHKVTTRNTATAFLSEMLNYGVITQRPHPDDRRMRIMAPAAATIEAMANWIGLHLFTLDMLDGGKRYDWFQSATVPLLAHLQPTIAARLLTDETIRSPHQAFAHFMWMNSGFLVTERLIVALTGNLTSGERLPISLTSAAELTAGLNLSRSHSARKISEAEDLEILGWTGTKGRSPMWVSRAFLSSFLDIQAAKLAIIDEVVSAHRAAVSALEVDKTR